MRVIFIVLLQHALRVEPHELDAVICFGISWRAQLSKTFVARSQFALAFPIFRHCLEHAFAF
jgi:hypothetical protein